MRGRLQGLAVLAATVWTATVWDFLDTALRDWYRDLAVSDWFDDLEHRRPW